MRAERFECRFCGETLVSGDSDGNNMHFANNHVVDYIDELERGGATELEAHQRAIALVGSLRAPAR